MVMLVTMGTPVEADEGTMSNILTLWSEHREF